MCTFAAMIDKKTFSTRVLTVLFLLVFGVYAHAQQPMTETERERVDTAVSVSLITCGPGEEAYSIYGHTALRFTDRSNGIDVAVNWGIFSFSKPFFVLRFVFGLTDYEIGIFPFDLFEDEYKANNRWIKEQALNLTADEKMRIAEAINENYRPENREYRYNYFYDNCTTRARDMVVQHLGSGVKYKESHDNGPSFRQLMHRCCLNRPWSRFGNDLLLGLQADRPTNISEQQFLPEVTMHDFETATLDDGRRLVTSSRMLVTADDDARCTTTFPLSPLTCAIIFLALTVSVTLLEIFLKKDFRWFDALLMLLCGLAGIVLTLMLFSQHPTVRFNLQLLLLNPLPLFFIWAMLRNKCHKQYKMWIILICLFYIGAIWQTYAEGMFIVASSLLIRNIKRLKREK